eukprot:TRINITY_DN13235_c0_g1_i1.p1 TRINITY_DN13235_c0_g1~~TRINITY_DN13235_c0_g1_i1.p1  ORF type:complete len:480 (+),score=110.01 TRINITY_DN13235_c0_g1_i1:192-1631(+)
MLQNLTPEQREAMLGIQRWTTVQDLQSVQLIWNKVVAECKKPDSDDSDPQPEGRTHDVGVGTTDVQSEPEVERPAPVIPNVEMAAGIHNLLPPLYPTDDEALTEVFADAGIELDSPSESLFASTETLSTASADVSDDAITELQKKIGDRLTKGVVDGLLKYTKLVILQRKRLEECIDDLGAQEGVLPGPSLLQKQRAVGAEADKLEVHLKIVEHLKKLLKLAQTCRSSSKKFELLSQVVLVLKKLQVGGSGSVPDRMDVLSLQAWIDEQNTEQLATASNCSSDDAAHSTESSELDPTDNNNNPSLLAWFVKTEAMNEIGILERCLTTNGSCYEVPLSSFKPTPQSKKECHTRAVAVADKNWPLDLLVCCSTLLLHRKIPLFEEWTVQMDSVPVDCDFQVVSHIPFYKGEYVVPGGKSGQPFAINGQTGTVYVVDPPLSLHQQLLQTVRDVLRRPSTWFLLNGAALCFKFATRRPPSSTC